MRMGEAPLLPLDGGHVTACCAKGGTIDELLNFRRKTLARRSCLFGDVGPLIGSFFLSPAKRGCM